jgi:CheY-like chemotaxis protein
MMDPNRPILLIEDRDEDFEVTCMAIRQAGVANPLLRCRTGREARDYIAHNGHYMHAVEPLFILVDLNLPGVDGRKVLAELRNSAWLSAVPAIVLSTSTNARDVRLCYQLGAAGYLIKPVDLERFQAMMATLTKYWMQVVRLPEQEELGYAR